MIISVLISIFDIANKEEKALAVKPGLFIFNYWKRTEEAGCATGRLAFLCSMVLNAYRPFISRPVIIGFRERR